MSFFVALYFTIYQRQKEYRYSNASSSFIGIVFCHGKPAEGRERI